MQQSGVKKEKSDDTGVDKPENTMWCDQLNR